MIRKTHQIQRSVGLSTEDVPSTLSRVEQPYLSNVEVDRGAVVMSRDGYEVIIPEQAKDASLRLRGAIYHASLYGQFRDAIVIPYDSRYAFAGAGLSSLFVSFVVEFDRSGIGNDLSTIGDGTEVFVWGTTASASAMKIRVFIDYSSGYRWNLQCYDSTGATAVTATVADSDLDTGSVGKKRYIEIKVGVNMSIAVYDAADGSSIGSDSDTANVISPTVGTPMVFGMYVDSNGYPSNVATHHALHAKIAEIRIAQYVTYVGGEFPEISTSSDVYSRELRPSEYKSFLSGLEVVSYFKCNDGNHERIYDSCDTVENPLYRGSRKGNHGRHWNVAPQWILEDNEIPVFAASNPDISDHLGITLLRRTALFFNGLQGHIQGRSGWVQATIVNDPLKNIFEQAPASGVGWTVELIVTLLMHRGETTYPDCTLYDSGIAGVIAVNPIRFYVSSDKFVCQFKDSGGTRTVTISTEDVSDFVGETITIVATKSNTTITFFVIGENKQTALYTVSSPNAGSVGSGADDGPFVIFGRTIQTVVDSQSDDPATYANRSFHGVFHEYRLWSVPKTLNEAYAVANREVPVAARNFLAVYLIADKGTGNQLSNYGTSVTVTLPTITVGTQVYSQNSYIDTRILPTQETGPIFSEGLVTPFLPVRVHGAIDFRRGFGSRVARRLVFVAGSTLYEADLSANTLTARSSGIPKRRPMMSMEVADGNVYFCNGGRPLVYDGNAVRYAGIAAPIERPWLSGGDTSNSGGSLDDGSYLIGYRFLNTRAGTQSNISPLRQFTLTGGTANQSRLLGLHGIEVPTDPQVDAIEILCTLEGSATRLYSIEKFTDITAGSRTFATAISTLSTTAAPVDVTRSLEVPSFGATTTYGDLYKFGEPPPSRLVKLFGGRMLYAATFEPGRFYFSRILGGPQFEHVDITPGLEGAVDIKTDAGDEIQAFKPLDSTMIAFLRDASAVISQSGLDPSLTGGLDIPYSIDIRDNDVGTVSPYSVTNVTNAHAFLSKTDVYVRSGGDYRVISSPSSNPGQLTQPRVGRSIRSLNGDALDLTCAMHRQARQQLWWAVAESGYDRPNAIYVYSYRERAWMRHVMPSVDFILEVEESNDQRIAVGFVNGFVCKIHETGRTVDSYDSNNTAGGTATISASALGVLTLSTNVWTAHHLRGKPVVIGGSGAYKTYVIADNDKSGSFDRLYLTDVAPSSTYVAVGKTAYIGSVNPEADFVVNPGTETEQKRYREIELVSSGNGNSDVEMNVWFDRFEFDPAVSAAATKGRALAFSATSQFIRADLLGMARFLTMRLYAPKPGRRMNFSMIAVVYEPCSDVKSYG